MVEGRIDGVAGQPVPQPGRAAAIRDAITGARWINKFRMGPGDPLDAAVLGYTRLLGFRRFLAMGIVDGLTVFGTDPADKSQTMNEITNRIGPRRSVWRKKVGTTPRSRGSSRSATNCTAS